MVSFDTVFPKVGGSPHPHACIIFDDLSCYRKIASKFILEGLSNNEKCMMAIDSYKQSMIAEDFSDAGVNINDYLEEGKLTILDVKESYSGNGGFDPDQTIKIWQDLSKKATDEGYDALRVVGEATFSIGGPELADKLIYYENKMNEVLFPNYPFKSLCVYDKNLYQPEVIKAAISAHPILFYNDELYLENIHYVPPEIHFKSGNAQDEIDIWLANVKRNNMNVRSLIESEQKFRSMFESAPLSYQSLDENGNFIEVNETWLKVLGYKRDDVIGHNFSEFLHPDWREHFKENFPRFKAIGEILGAEFEMVKKDGNPILVSFQGKIGKDSNDSFKQTHCIFQDITEQKKSEIALKVSEEQHRSILETTMDGFLLVDTNGRLLEVNQTYCHMSGYGQDELLTMKISDLDIKEDDTDTFEHLKRLVALGEDRFESQHRRKDGSVFDVEVSAQHRGKYGERCICFLRDITERKQSENTLKSSEQKWRNILVNTPQVGISLDPDANIIFANTHFLKMTGWEEHEVIGQNWFDMFIPENIREEICKAFSITMRQTEILLLSTYENEIVTKNGELRSIAWSNALTKDSHGNITDMTCLGVDLTERKNWESRLQQAQKMESIGNLAGGIAHDFNNLLSPIIGISELLLEDLTPGSPQYEDVQEILKAGKRGGDLVKQILSFSRQDEYRKITVRVQQIVKEVIKLSRSTIPADIEITSCIQPDCGLVLADPTQLHQIAMNLITNAFHAIEDSGGKIDIKVKEKTLDESHLIGKLEKPGKYVVFSVSDNGIGIPSVHLQKIFDPYFTTKEKGKGTGLGLSVVYGLVKDHQGEITVYSEVGQGTTFNVYLPLNKQSGEFERTKKPESIATGTERILFVDDENSIVALEKKVLERQGYSVVGRTSSIDALEAFKAHPDAYDLIISDMNMPNMTGVQLAKEMLTIRPDIPIIICTGFSERMSENIAKDIGVKGFLMKPVVMAEMAKEMRRVLDEGKGGTIIVK